MTLAYKLWSQVSEDIFRSHSPDSITRHLVTVSVRLKHRVFIGICYPFSSRRKVELKYTFSSVVIYKPNVRYEPVGDKIT